MRSSTSVARPSILFLAIISILEVLVRPHDWFQRIFPFAVCLPIATFVLARMLGGRLHAASFPNNALDAAASLGAVAIVVITDLNRTFGYSPSTCRSTCVYGLTLVALAVFLGLPQLYAYIRYAFARAKLFRH